MRGLDFLSGHEDLPVGIYGRLRDIQTIVDILSETEHNNNFVRGSGGLDLGHLRGVEFQRIAHICCCHLWVERAVPCGVCSISSDFLQIGNGRDGRGGAPYPSWIPGDPALGECDELCAV